MEFAQILQNLRYFAEYAKFIKQTKSKNPKGWNNPDFNNPQQPVVGINWKEAVKFCKWQGKRLPTEAEWHK